MSDKGRLIIEHLYQNRDYAWISRTSQGANDIRPNNLVLILQVWTQQRDVAFGRFFKNIKSFSVPLPQLFYDSSDFRGGRDFMVNISVDNQAEQVKCDDDR